MTAPSKTNSIAIPHEHGKNSRLWARLASIMLLTCTLLSSILWLLAQRFDLTVVEAGELAFRAFVLKSLEVVTAIYDPYSPHAAKLGPDDWQGWPSDALEPGRVVATLQSRWDRLGTNIKLGQTFIRQVDDKATAFAYQPSDVKALRDLRDRYNLDTLLRGEMSQITEVAALNNWVRSQWIHGVDGPVDFKKFYAGDILEAASRGAQYWCQVASMTFAQIAASMGYQARLVSLSLDRGPPQHAITEVWIDNLDKWIVFDTDFNVYYIDKSGAPLNALDLHRALIQDRSSDIAVVKGSYRPETFDIEDALARPLLLPYYRYFYIDMRNDWLTNVYFSGHPRRSDRSTLRWAGVEQTRFLDLKPVTADEMKLYPPLNHVEIRLGTNVDVQRPPTLSVYFKTITPNFDRFEITVNDTLQFAHRSSYLAWHLTPGVNTLTARAVNTLGIKGLPSRIEILWDEG